MNNFADQKDQLYNSSYVAPTTADAGEMLLLTLITSPCAV